MTPPSDRIKLIVTVEKGMVTGIYASEGLPNMDIIVMDKDMMDSVGISTREADERTENAIAGLHELSVKGWES